jgi:molecular chaperone GrpE
MSDKEEEIPVKVVDRRWWANPESASADRAPSGGLKPTYVEQLEAQLAEKDRQAQEYLAKYRQASAEFDEARLRLRKEISKDIERARRDVLIEMLEVLDNLDRAIDAAERSGANQGPFFQGVELVRRQFLARLESLGVQRIDAAGQRFDPALHEAVVTVPTPSKAEDGIIVGVVRPGYRIGDQILRPAAVAVGKCHMEQAERGA